MVRPFGGSAGGCNAATLQQLRDPDRRPCQPYAPVDPALLSWLPEAPVALPAPALLSNLRCSRRGAAPGPTGLTAEIARLLLDDADSSEAFCGVAQLLARARLPPSIASALGLGRLVALRKPTGGVRGLVVGDFLRRLVARTPAQHYSRHIDEATRPHQFALSTRAGAEALAHSLQLETDTDPSCTVLSVDGIGAFDFVSRQAMLSELRHTPEASAMLPFVRLFYGAPSSFVWTDDEVVSHLVSQGEGGEQGDPLMPASFALALAPALRSFQEELHPGEHVRAFLDDIYVTTSPARTASVLSRLEHHLFASLHIRLHAGKTRVWNSAGVRPPHLPPPPEGSTTWVGDSALPPQDRGLRVLGSPLGTDEYVAAQLQHLSVQHRALLQLLPGIHDLQVSWLLLLFCASPRVHYCLRLLPPALTAVFAAEHDRNILCCLAQLLHIVPGDADPLPQSAAARANLSLRHGGLGLRSAAEHAPAAYFASWADSLGALRVREPDSCHIIARLLDDATSGPSLPRCLSSLAGAVHLLRDTGFPPPAFADLPLQPPVVPANPDEPVDTTRGWQRPASRAIDDSTAGRFRAMLDAPSLALLESQCGPFASRILTALPSCHELTLDSCFPCFVAPPASLALASRRCSLSLPPSCRPSR